MNKILLGMAAASALAISSVANASFVMYLDDTSTPGIDKILMDNAGVGAATGGPLGLDFTNVSDGLGGAIDQLLYAGGVGTWTVSITSALTKTAASDPVEMSMSTNSTSSGAGTLVIGISDTDFTPDQGYNFELASTAVGDSISATGYSDPANGLFGLVNSSAVLSLSASGFANDPDFLATGAPFSLSMITTITHTSAQTTNSTNSFKVVPEPSILALFGTGLIGLGLARRRMKK